VSWRLELLVNGIVFHKFFVVDFVELVASETLMLSTFPVCRYTGASFHSRQLTFESEIAGFTALEYKIKTGSGRDYNNKCDVTAAKLKTSQHVILLG
jgi:hypothetical protein